MSGWRAALLGLALLLAGCGAHAEGRATATPAPSPTPPPVALLHYVNPAYPYEIGYPAGWQALTSDPDSVKFVGPDGRQITVTAAAVPDRKPPVSPAEYADAQVEALRRTAPGLIELNRGRIGLPNKQAGIEVALMWGPASTPHGALLLYALDNSIGYTLRADAPASISMADRRTLDASLRSFTLTPSD